MELKYKTSGSWACPHLNSKNGKSTLKMKTINDCPFVYGKPCHICNLASPNKCGDCVHFYYDDTHYRHFPFGSCMYSVRRVSEKLPTNCIHFKRREPGDFWYPDWIEEELKGYLDEFDGDERKARATARKKWYVLNDKVF
jgi:hypothetical protein